MRRKKHKHARRAVRFYKINGGFREPFKVTERMRLRVSASAARLRELDVSGALSFASVLRCGVRKLQVPGVELCQYLVLRG